jgi:hypothetical protein
MVFPLPHFGEKRLGIKCSLIGTVRHYMNWSRSPTILAKKHPKQKCRATMDFASIEERGNLACGNEAPSRASTGSMASRHLVILGSQKAVPVWSILTTVLY